MHHHETGSNYHETLDLNSEMADCKRVTGDELTCLKLNVAAHNVPDYLHELVKTNLPPEEHDTAVATLQSAVAKSPNLFSSDNPDDNLKRAARVLGIPEIAALEAQEAALDVQNDALLQKSKNLGQEEAELKTRIKVLSNAEQLVDWIKTNPKFGGLQGPALLDALLADPSVAGNPELATRLTDIENKLNGMASLGTEAEQAVLTNYINTASLSLAADTDYGVFRDLVAKVENDDTISEATKAKVRAHFGVAQVETASDLQRLMVEGYGKDERGKVIAITEKNKAEVFPDTFVYEQPDGDHIFEVTTPNGGALKIRFDETTSNQDLLERGFTAQVFGGLAQAGIADAIIGRNLNLQDGGVLSLHQSDIIKSQRIITMINGSDPTAEGRLLSSDDTSSMRDKLVAFSKTGGTDPITDLKALSIIRPDGTLNWTQFEKATIFINQSVASNGGVPSYDQLKNELLGGSE